MPRNISSAGGSKATSRSASTPSSASPSASKTASSTERPSSAISELSTVKGSPRAIAAWLRWSSGDRPASPSPLPERCLERMIRETYPKSSSRPFAWLNPSSFSWRTRQTRKGLRTQPTGEGFSLAWPRSATMRDGIVFERATWAPRIGAIVSGYLLAFLNGKLAPTPVKADGERGSESYYHGESNPTLKGWAALLPTPTTETGGYNRGGGGGRTGPKRYTLNTLASKGMLPTPTAGDFRNSRNSTANRKPGSKAHSGETLCDRLLGTPTATDHNTMTSRLPEDDQGRLKLQIRGPLNPSLHLWLMGWPEGASDFEPLGRESFRSWLRSHGIDC